MPTSDANRDSAVLPVELADADGIRAELARILASLQFRGSQRIRQFLEFVVEETLAGRGGQIKAYVIALDCFAREPDFDPQIDPYVRIVARRLRRALRHYYEDSGGVGGIRIDMPKGSYVPVFAFVDAPSSEAASAGPAAGGSSDRAVAVAGRAAAVAVVRFEGHGEEFLASGLTQEIMLALSRFSELLVVGPISLPAADVRDSSPRDIGREHDADFVLLGTVHQLGDKVRISMSLTETASATMMWAQRYERDLAIRGLFEVQDEIAAKVAGTIGDAAGVVVRQVAERTRGRCPQSLSSYEAALRAFHWGIELSDSTFAAAHEALEHAVASDPEYALGKALLSDIYFSDWLSGVGMLENSVDRAEFLADEAVRLDAFLSDAHWATGQVRFARRDFARFHAEFDAARSLNPSKALYLASYGLFLVALKDFDRAVELVAAATDLNPQHPPWYHLVPTMAHAHGGDWQGAYASAERFVGHQLMWGPLLRAMALGHLGHADQAAEEIAALLEIQPRFVATGRELMGRLLYDDENIELVTAGLAAAGLELE